MQFARLFARVLALAALISPLVLWPTLSLSEPRAPLFSASHDACYGRVYEAAHLKNHPKQKVTSIHIMRSVERRREAENWTPDDRAETIRNFREEAQLTVNAFAAFRDRKGTFYNSLSCGKETADGIRCMIDCDGGSFRLTRAGANAVLLHNEGFVLVGGCDEDVEESQEVYFSPGADDKVFRLDTKPMAACRAEEQKATPIRSGLPLRERFKEDEQFCFGRDFDAAHLASHPKQMVSQIRVGRLAPGTEREDRTTVKWWWLSVKLDVSVTLRSNLKTTTVRYACIPQQASWECHRQIEDDEPALCSDRSIHLVRGPGDDILLYNRNSGLPINNECETAKLSQDQPVRPPTRSDDRVFRLTRMPIRQCQL